MHLLSMRTRQEEYCSVVEHVLNLLPEKLPISCFAPEVYRANGAMYSYDVYDFERPLQSYPSLCHGKYLTDAIYFAGESSALWLFPPQITRFEATLEILDYSNKEGMRPVEINGQKYGFGSVSVPIIDQKLMITTEPGDRTFYAMSRPRLYYQVDVPSTVFI